MSLTSVEKEIQHWDPDLQDQLAAFLSVLRLKRTSAHAKELARRLSDRTPGAWLTLPDLKKKLADG